LQGVEELLVAVLPESCRVVTLAVTSTRYVRVGSVKAHVVSQ